ncbi:MAG: preprotein translocase subunit SecE [Desulfobacteraceae bacterium]|jgi:preprotein translocase subunit SecE
MGRILKKKTENQKIKLKDRLKQKNELNPSEDGRSESTDAPASKEAAKRVVAPKKMDDTKKATQIQEPGYFQQVSQFFREVKAELKKVVWPPKNQAIASTIVVIILVIIVSSLLGFFDLILKGLIQMVLK